MATMNGSLLWWQQAHNLPIGYSWIKAITRMYTQGP